MSGVRSHTESKAEHRLVGGTLVVEANGVHARCVCGWDSGGRFSSMTASCAWQDHLEAQSDDHVSKNTGKEA